MNELMNVIVTVGVLVIFFALLGDWHKAIKLYNIKHNGYRWVVRDNKGRFVLVSKSFWDVLKLGVR